MIEIQVNASKKYDVFIENGLSKDLPEGVTITDTNLLREYPSLMREPKIVIEAGETSKSFENYEKIINKLSEFNAEKIIAIGGGVVGDIAGFAASTFKRGIPIIHVPTSLLAMVDSSIGGKNGINIGKKKNYLGTIYQPEKVIIDPLFLLTLPKEELNNGMAEVIKYSILFDIPKLEEISKITNENLIYECCRAKIQVVEAEERDMGYRYVLNFGHTIGHALELLTGLRHGEAISIGMIKELELANLLGLISREKIEFIKTIFVSNNLPIELPKNLDVKQAMEIMKSDKKGEYIFALTKEKYNVPIKEEMILEIMK